MNKQPWFKFYPSDWFAERSLQRVSREARSFWFDVLCLIHQGGDGRLHFDGRIPSDREIGATLGDNPRTVRKLLLELEREGVFSRDADGFIISRRAIRDQLKLNSDRINGMKGGNPTLKNQTTFKQNNDLSENGVNPPDNRGVKAHIPEARSQKGKAEERGDAVDARENSPPPSDPSPPEFAPMPERYGGGGPPGRLMTTLPAAWRSEGGDPASILDSPALLSAALDAGMTTETARDEAHRFADHHAARDSSFADWPAAWRNWCRRHADFSRNRGGPGPSGGPHADRGGSGGGLVGTILRRRADRLAVGGWEYPAGRA